MKNTKFVKEFTPNWFAVIMGNGGTALVLAHFAAYLSFLSYFATGLWLINILLFLFFTGLFILRFFHYPHHFLLMFKHPVQPLFLGCVPMALLTIANGFIAFGIPLLGHATAINYGISCWWISVVLALIIVWAVPFAMFVVQEHALHNMTPVWLLPLVACEVASASGGLFIPHLAPSVHLTILFLCLGLWSISVTLAFIVITIFFKRLVIHSLPEDALAPSIWLVLGPLGTGALGLLTLSHASTVIAIDTTPYLKPFMDIFPGVGLLGAIIFWGFAFWWLITAIISSIYQFIKGINFALSWWAFTFPLAVYTLAVLAIADQTHIKLFKIQGVITTFFLIAIWIVVAAKTIPGAINQNLFSAPCLKDNDK